MGSTCDCLFSLTLQPAASPSAGYAFRVPQPVRSGAAVNGRSAAFRATIYLDWCWIVTWGVCPLGDREGWDWLYFRPGRPAGQVLSRLGAARSRQAAGGGRL